MERSRDGYRGRYRDRHEHESRNGTHADDRFARGSYRGRLSHETDYAPHNAYNYRSSRAALSRNGTASHYRHSRADDEPVVVRSSRSERDYSRYEQPSHRREPYHSSFYAPSSSSSSYRDDRSTRHGSRDADRDRYVRDRHRSPARPDPYGDSRPTVDYRTRPERYEPTSGRSAASSSAHRADSYRSSSHVSMSSPSSYAPRDQYPPDMSRRPVSHYETHSSSTMDHQDSFCRTSRDRNYNEYQPAYVDRANLKRPSSRYDDDDRLDAPSKRPARR